MRFWPASFTSATATQSSSSCWLSGFSRAMILPGLRKVSTALSTAATTALGLSDLCFCLTVLSGRISSLTWTTRGSRQSWMEEVVICICEGSQEYSISLQMTETVQSDS